MFGKKQKIKVIAADRPAERAEIRPPRRLIGDIVPKRAAYSAAPKVARISQPPAKTPAILAESPVVPSKIAETTSKGVASKALPRQEITSSAVAPFAPKINIIQSSGAGTKSTLGQTPAIRGGKFDFLTREPIVSVPKLPERPGIFSGLRAKFAGFDWRRSGSKKTVGLEEEPSVIVVPEDRGQPLKLLIGGAFAFLILIVGGGFFVISAFASLTINIVPRMETVAVDKIFKVFKEGGDVAAEVLPFAKTVEASKETTGRLEANSKAHGQIVIYNAYGKESQQLVKRTRFETPDGKIYRLIRGVTVPGAVVKNGAPEPGLIEVEVEADQSGEDYNIGLTDFTIPGFKGTARYTKFYGRSKTAMTGGSTSQKRVVSRADIDALKAELAGRLEEEAVSAAKAQVPEGFILLDDAYSVSYGDAVANPPLDGEGKNVTVSMTAEFRGLLIKKELLAEAIAASYGEDGLSQRAHVENTDELTLRVVQKKLEVSEMSVSVSGNARFVWNVDEAALKNDLLSKKPIAEIFGTYDGVEKAEVIYHPSFWHFIPKNKDKIEIVFVK